MTLMYAMRSMQLFISAHTANTYTHAHVKYTAICTISKIVPANVPGAWKHAKAGCLKHNRISICLPTLNSQADEMKAPLYISACGTTSQHAEPVMQISSWHTLQLQRPAPSAKPKGPWPLVHGIIVHACAVVHHTCHKQLQPAAPAPLAATVNVTHHDWSVLSMPSMPACPSTGSIRCMP